jgi:hypothetical protein
MLRDRVEVDMRARETAKLLTGSIVVYVIMAACASSGPASLDLGEGRLGQSNGSSGIAGSGGGSVMDGSGHDGPSIFDVLMNPVTNAEANLSGTRLKVNFISGVDGSQVITGMHDSQRNEDCAFTIAADGVLRCLPSGSYSVGVYTDAGCAQPIVGVAKGCTATYAIVAAATSCGAQTHVYTLGPAFTGAKSYALNDDGICVTYPATGITTFETTLDLYTLGSEVPASSFVQGTLQTGQ